MKETKLMVTNLVHLQNAITEPCVLEEVSRVLRSSKRWGGGRGWCWARAREKNDLKDIIVITFCSSTASVTNFSKKCSRRSNVKFYSCVYFSFLRPTFCFIQGLLILGHMVLPVIS